MFCRELLTVFRKKKLFENLYDFLNLFLNNYDYMIFFGNLYDFF